MCGEPYKNGSGAGWMHQLTGQKDNPGSASYQRMMAEAEALRGKEYSQYSDNVQAGAQNGGVGGGATIEQQPRYTGPAGIPFSGNSSSPSLTPGSGYNTPGLSGPMASPFGIPTNAPSGWQPAQNAYATHRTVNPYSSAAATPAGRDPWGRW